MRDHVAMAEHRISRSEVQGADEFDRLQTLHESAASCLDGRLGELPPGLRALTVLFAYVGEVDNGGFAAWMYNSTGRLTGEAIAAAKLIGAVAHAGVIERFASVALENDLAMDDEARESRLEQMSDDEIAALDEEFYALPSIEPLLSAYVDGHPGEFFTD